MPFMPSTALTASAGKVQSAGSLVVVHCKSRSNPMSRYPVGRLVVDGSHGDCVATSPKSADRSATMISMSVASSPTPTGGDAGVARMQPGVPPTDGCSKSLAPGAAAAVGVPPVESGAPPAPVTVGVPPVAAGAEPRSPVVAIDAPD